VTARYRETADTLAAQFLDGVQGLRTLRSLDRAQTYGDAIAEEAERLRLDTMRLLRVNQHALLGVDSLFTIGTVVAAAGMAAWRLSNAAITVGDGVALVLLGVMLIEPLTQIGRFFYVGAIGRASAAQLGRLFAAAPPRIPPAVVAAGSSPVSGDGGLAPRPTPPGTILLHGVRFAYGDGPHVLRGISLSVAPGDKVALTGPSGAGKSTLVSLVAGLHRPTAGMIEVSGRVALVPQRPYLFTGTVGDNLRVARHDASDDRLWEVLDATELGDLVRERGGLTTEVGEHGLQLSGGEAQRLAVARALLLDAPIVVLDEPTSNVDLETEAKLTTAIARLTEGRTVLVIAHRRSTLSGCDRFLEMKAGVIAEADFATAADEDSPTDPPAADMPSDDPPSADPPSADPPPVDGGPA
jgi:ABC-type transport system involved in cytochrome bd biosynthesis fused ATPase/permease subunit